MARSYCLTFKFRFTLKVYNGDKEPTKTNS